jgi:hypothetical protein
LFEGIVGDQDDVTSLVAGADDLEDMVGNFARAVMAALAAPRI